MTEDRKNYLREFQKNWVKKRREEWIISQGGRCVYCGSSESLEVDHIVPEEKELQPAAIWSRKLSVREKELSKCQVLCSSCHQEKTNLWYFKKVKHGSSSMYSKYKCRCDKCREFKRIQNAKR